MFNLLDPELLQDPARGYSRIREEEPITRGGFPGMDPLWIVTRYDDVKLVLNDPRFVNNAAGVPGLRVGNLAEQAMLARGLTAEFTPYMLAGMLELDGADHLRLRRLVSRAFTARRVNELRPRVEEITERLLAGLPELAEDGVVDLLAHFAYPLPIMVICELVGIPEQDRPLLREWSAAMSTPGGDLPGALRDFVAYTHELIERRRAEPGDDLVTALVRAQDEDGDRLSDVEMVTLVLTLVIAGHETTANLIGNGTAALLTHPDQLDLLCEDPGLTPQAVHELLRWCGPALLTRMRYATEDVQIGDVLVSRGEAVMPILVSANRDPGVFPDPDRLDITRVPEGRRETHVGFSHGLHYCLGAALARQEGEVAFEALLRHFPGLSLAVAPGELARAFDPSAWRLAALPVRLTAE